MESSYDTAVRTIEAVLPEFAGETYNWQAVRIGSVLAEAGLLVENEGILTLHLPAEEIARLDWHTVSVLTQGRGVLLIPTDGADK